MSTQDYDPTRRSQAPTDEQIPHSGVHHDEQPVREFDNTPLDQAPIDRELPHGVTTGHLPDDMQPPVTKEKSKRGLLIGAGASIGALAIGTGLFLGLGQGGGSEKSTEPRTDAGTSAPATPGTEQGPVSGTAERVDPPAELSPEVVSGLTSEEMTERFRIDADSISTPEEFAEAYVTRENAFYKLGCTKEEWESVPRNSFVDTMRAKYFAPVSDGLNGFVGNDYNIRSAWNACNMMYTGGLDGYSYNEQLVPGSVTSDANPDGTFNVTFRIHATDNRGELKKLVGDIDGTDSVDQIVSYHMNHVHRNAEGGLVADSTTADNVDN